MGEDLMPDLEREGAEELGAGSGFVPVAGVRQRFVNRR